MSMVWAMIRQRKSAEDMDLTDKISFCGCGDNDMRLQVLEESQMMVLPSNDEVLPVSVWEALSFGFTVAATDAGDISSAARGDVDGFLATPGEVKGISFAIAALIRDRDKWEQCSAASIKSAQTKFSEKDFFERPKRVYLSGCDKKPRFDSVCRHALVDPRGEISHVISFYYLCE